MTDEHHGGLLHDVETFLTRRRMLGIFASTAASGLAACDQMAFFSKAEEEVAATGADGLECVVHPAETEGPFPADGSNSAHGTLANVLRDSGIVRRDMRTSLVQGGPTADGVALRLSVQLVAVGQSCRPLAGHAIYLWHCDAQGRYSLYQLEDASYLRGVSVTDANGKATFETIVPGCYRGRYPHLHFEIYPSLEKATDYRNRILTSQLVVPGDVCRVVYSTQSSYAVSLDNFLETSVERDGIFRDNTPKQLAAQTLSMKSSDSGHSYDASVTIGVRAG